MSDEGGNIELWECVCRTPDWPKGSTFSAPQCSYCERREAVGMAVIARCGHCNLPVLDSENRIFDGEQMYHQAHYAEAMRNQRDATREQLRGAVEALRRIAANDPMDPTPQEAAERALDDLGLSHFGEQ